MQRNLKIFAALFLVFSLSFSFLFLLSKDTIANESSSEGHKVKICHSTSSHTNPYTKNNVDKNSTVQGHNIHTGPIWFSGIEGDWGDIIPPFEYEESCPPNGSNEYKKSNCELPGNTCLQGNKCASPIPGGTYLGMNWTELGQEIWRNRCNTVEEEYEECSETVISYGDWSDWITYPKNKKKEYRERTVSQLDSQNNSIVCSSKVEKEFRYRLCSVKYPIYGSWSNWEVDPEDSSKEYKERDIVWKDFYKHSVCNTETQRKTRDIKYVECSVTDEIEGEWTPWKVDTEDDSRLVSEATITYVDSKNSEKICKTEIIKKYQDRELCDWETAKYADDPLCVEPEEDEPSVLGTTTVVLADTAGGEDTNLYLVQSIFAFVTGSIFIYAGGRKFLYVA
jgi:hypothetical protein